MRINVAVPEAHVSAPVLDAALEATTRLNESMLRTGEIEPFDMKAPGVRWRPEPPGDGEHFDHGRLVLGRGWGDCDDLAPWHAASLRATGRDRGARAFARRSGPDRWHALVRRSDGRIEDPSIAAGMPGPGARHGVRGATQPLMFSRRASVVGGAYIMRPQLALRPVLDRLSRQPEAWQARADLPWHASPGLSPADIAMVSLHASPVSSQALVGALEGAIALGVASDAADDEHLDRLRCISDMCQGASWEDCCDEYGREHADAAGQIVGQFFRKLGRGFKRFGRGLGRFALKAAPMALNFIPGVGPVASQAFQAAAPALQELVARREHLPPEPASMPFEYPDFRFQQAEPYGPPPYAPPYVPRADYAPAPPMYGWGG